MEKYVIKRNGAYLPFESYKIKEAIQKAFQSESQKYHEDYYL
jgi:ribonucleoside-triphosphate reductase